MYNFKNYETMKTIDALENLRQIMPQNNNNTKQENDVDSPAPKANEVDIEDMRELLSGSAEYLKALAERDDNYYFFKEIERIGERIWEMFYPDC